MFPDMPLLVVSDDAPCSDGSESMAVGLSGPLFEMGPGTRPVELLMSPLPQMAQFAGC